LIGSNAGGLFQVFEVFSTTWIVTLAAVLVDATALEAFAATPLTVDHGCWEYCCGSRAKVSSIEVEVADIPELI
jgi:hypothetical protein